MTNNALKQVITVNCTPQNSMETIIGRLVDCPRRYALVNELQEGEERAYMAHHNNDLAALVSSQACVQNSNEHWLLCARTPPKRYAPRGDCALS